MSNQSPVAVLLAALIFALLTGCSGPRFYESRLVASEYDDANAATRVTANFEIWAVDGLPINDVTADELKVFEDGVLASSESTLDLSRTLHPIQVILLLDRSSSMRADGGGADNRVQETARQILDGLAGHPCTVELYSFANTVDRLQSLDDLSEAGSGDARSRWTALYFAIGTVLNDHGLLNAPKAAPADPDEPRPAGQAPETPSTVLIVCTDGADNYSHNFDLMTLLDLEKQVRDNRVVVHALGLGEVRSEQDRQGVTGEAALRRLAVNGSYQRAGDALAIETLVGKVTRHIRATYACVYVSPSITGEHELVFQVDRGGRKGRSKPIRFKADGPR